MVGISPPEVEACGPKANSKEVAIQIMKASDSTSLVTTDRSKVGSKGKLARTSSKTPNKATKVSS